MSHQTNPIILHADDFGRTIETTTSVLRCIDRNVITSVTAMANAPGTEHALAAVLPLQPHVSVGVHLNFCEGQPLTDVPTLVDDRGHFFSKRSMFVRAMLNRFSVSDLERECTAQLSRVRDAGIAISHIDGHKHLHLLPRVAPIVARVARRFGVERVRCPVDGVRRQQDWPRLASGLVRTRIARAAHRHFSAAGLRHPDRLIDVVDLIGAANHNVRVTLLTAPLVLTEVMCHPRPRETGVGSPMTDAEFLLSDQFAALLAETRARRCTHWDCRFAMRILMVAPEAFFTPRGTPLSVYHRISELEAMGHDLDVLTYPFGAQPASLRVRVHRSASLPFLRHVRPGPSLVKLALDLLLTVKLIALLNEDTYDLLYAHEEAGLLSALLASRWNLRYIYEMHSSLPLQFAEWNVANFGLSKRLFGWVERVSIRRALAVVTTSPALAAIARAVHPSGTVVSLMNVYRLNGTVPAGRIRELRASLGLTDSHKVVMYTGSFVAIQDLDRAIHAIKPVISREPQARFVFVGGGESEIRLLRRLVRTLDVDAYVHLEPNHPQEDMAAFMALSDVLISPRARGVNAPGKLATYLSAARPIVATDCPVHNQFLTSDTAILVPPTAEGLAEGILSAFENAALVARITANAGRVFDAMFDADARAATYDQLFAGLPR